MTTDIEEPTLTVDELAARAGVTVRTVRFYGTKGLLPPPVIGPRRVGHYGQEHLARLALIEELQHQGMTLAAIERYLQQLPDGLSAHDLAIHRAVVASWAPDAAEDGDARGAGAAGGAATERGGSGPARRDERRQGRGPARARTAWTSGCCGSASSCSTYRSRTRRSSPRARSC